VRTIPLDFNRLVYLVAKQDQIAAQLHRAHQGGNGATPILSLEGKCLPHPMALPKLPPVPEFPLSALPDALRAWVADAADRARFRPDFAAVASMCALGSPIGRRLGICLKQQDDWTEPA
jgi:hypothetical protein